LAAITVGVTVKPFGAVIVISLPSKASELTKIMFLSLSLLTISTTATYAVQPEDDKKENEALQTSSQSFSTV